MGRFNVDRRAEKQSEVCGLIGDIVNVFIVWIKSDVIVKFFIDILDGPGDGKVLDVGCSL